MNGSALGQTTGGAETAFIEGTNYLRFDGVAPVAGVITVDMLTTGVTPTAVTFLNGFEIASVPGAATPGTLIYGK